MRCWCGKQVEPGIPHYPADDPENGPKHYPSLLCDSCGEPGAAPAVREQDISGPGEPAYDAPVKVGNLCPTCQEEDDADLLSDWE